MYYVSAPMEGLGATRPTWCPPTVAGRPDPCEIRYSVDLPIIGREIVGVPLNQVISDAMTQFSQRLPSLLQEAYLRARPLIDEQKAEAIADLQVAARDFVDKTMKEKIRPELERQKTDAFARAEVLKDDATVKAAVIAGVLVVAMAAAAWWLKR